jgi:hypothetical protein
MLKGILAFIVMMVFASSMVGCITVQPADHATQLYQTGKIATVAIYTAKPSTLPAMIVAEPIIQEVKAGLSVNSTDANVALKQYLEVVVPSLVPVQDRPAVGLLMVTLAEQLQVTLPGGATSMDQIVLSKDIIIVLSGVTDGIDLCKQYAPVATPLKATKPNTLEMLRK